MYACGVKVFHNRRIVLLPVQRIQQCAQKANKKKNSRIRVQSILIEIQTNFDKRCVRYICSV